ncbi:MAG: c-type cytochrome [Pseudomonadota bacterium]
MLGVSMAGLFVAWTSLAHANGYQRLEGHGGPVKGVALSPDGAWALTASFDYSLGMWAMPEGRVGSWLDGHEAAVNTIAVFPDGKRAVSGGDDYRMILWDLETGSEIRRFEGHKGKIISIALSPDGTVAATSGWDGWIGLWDLSGAKPVTWLKGHASGVNDVAFSHDGDTLYSASSDGTIRRWNVSEGALERTLIKHGFGINLLVLDEASGWLAYGAVDGAVRVIDLATDAEVADLTADRKPILALSASPDRTQLAVGDGEGHIMIIDTRDWMIERDFRAAARGPVWALDWTPDGTRLLSGGLDDAAVFWPVAASDTENAERLAAGERTFLREPSEMTNGERQFARKCSICHTLTPDDRNRAGPTLWGLFGRRAGTVEGYAYSEALDGSDIVWGAETIDKLFDIGPDHYTPGSKMPMQRITGAEDRSDLIDYLAKNTGPATTDRDRGASK